MSSWPLNIPEGADPRFATVTVGQLLTMTSGLAGDDDAAGADSALEKAMIESRDWVRHILGRRLEHEPGDRFAYSNASSHLLSAIVADASRQSTFDFARTKLFGPLGIQTAGALEPRVGPIPPAVLAAYDKAGIAWIRDPQGYHYGASTLRLSAQDLAKLGYLYLNGGRWDGKQVVPAEFVATATSPAGSSPNLSSGYGWHWWVATEHGHRVFLARGFGGQFVYVVPHLDLMAVITSDAETSGADPKILIARTIVPAANT